MDRSAIYLSTTASDASEVARKYGLGIEIAEFCTAWNMDDEYAQTDAMLSKKLEGIDSRLLHAPFNELFPCAIDKKARELASYRYRQAAGLARHYGAKKLIVHGGYHPKIYYPIWYTEQSVVFWKEFLKEDPGVTIVLENVLEEEPSMLLDIVRGVDDPRLRLCLDVGHVNAYSHSPLTQWLTDLAPWLDHFHIHNNDGSWDTHSALNEGSIPMRRFLQQACALCPHASFTLELMQAEASVRWLLEESYVPEGSNP